MDVVMGTPHGLVRVLQADDQGAEVRKFKGYATFEGASYAPAGMGGDRTSHDLYVLKQGKAFKVSSIPKGGELVHAFGASPDSQQPSSGADAFTFGGQSKVLQQQGRYVGALDSSGKLPLPPTGERALPAEVRKALDSWMNDGCTVGADAVTAKDFDGDGVIDYALNGDGVVCDGRTLGGNGGTPFAVFSGKASGEGATVVDNTSAASATITRFSKFAVLAVIHDLGGGETKTDYWAFDRGKSQRIRKMPKGGQVVYELAR
jgi:hypothetical protein